MTVTYGTNLANELYGGSGNDSLYGWDQANAPGNFGPQNDNDTIYGSGGDDLIDGGAGNDHIYAWEGASTLRGGAGLDVAILSGQATQRLVFSLADSTVDQVIDGRHITGIEGISLVASDLNDSITGGTAADTLLGAAGDDYLAGGDGDDWLSGGGNASLAVHGGADTLLGGAGNDRLDLFDRFGADTIDGGTGIDLLVFDTEVAKRAVTVALAVSPSFTMPDGTKVTGVERISYDGTAGIDHITGGAYSDTLAGGGGADVLNGGGGDDVIVGGSTTKVAVTLLGGKGNDTITLTSTLGAEQALGGVGVDLLHLSFSRQTAGVVFNGAAVKGSFTMASGTVLAGFEQVDIAGGKGNDKLTGGALADTLFAGMGNDSLYGGGGNDVVSGAQGDDSLNGGLGNDTLIGSDGKDVMTGGAGADQFVFNAPALVGNEDSITDFTSGSDQIAFVDFGFGGLHSGPLAATAFVAGTAAQDADDRVIYDQATGRVWLDNDGTGLSDAHLVVTLAVTAHLTAADILVL